MGGKWFFTAAELAELALPGLSRAKRKINERAVEERWALRIDAAGRPLARQRKGRGGGLEYHVDVLPAAAKLELAKRGLTPDGPTPDSQDDGCAPRSCTWEWYETQPESSKAEAKLRAAVLARVEVFERTNLTRSAAVACAAAEAGVAASTLWGWLALVEGVDQAERLPFLAPRRTGGGAEAEVDERAWRFLKSDYLRPERPTFSSCYRRCQEYCAANGIELPHQRTLKRKLEREVDGRVIIARREGAEALRKAIPPQQRSVVNMHALELVNIDGHKFDVFCRFDDGRVGRPIMVAIQDIYSRKFLAWRVGETESAVLTRLAFASLFTKWGIPKGCVLDNGRAFASKWITGGATSRFRFKIREEEPTGILTSLGVKIHWTIPYRGQSKPIERGFRDLCDTIAKHPACHGAYTGNRPDAKPENYGSTAVPIDVFASLVEKGIAAHNARTGRRTETARGASFDDVFAASYATAPIGKATPEQLRLALLTADEVSTCRKSGAVTIFGNRYWVPAMSQLAGKKVTVRFVPDDLTLPVHVYDRQGRYLVTAEVLEQTGFLDADAAKSRARQEAEWRKATKRAVELEQLIAAGDLAAMMPDHIDEAPAPNPTVLRPVRHVHSAAAARAVQADQGHEVTPFIDRFAAGVGRLRVVE